MMLIYATVDAGGDHNPGGNEWQGIILSREEGKTPEAESVPYILAIEEVELSVCE